jgi:hypothetical protein
MPPTTVYSVISPPRITTATAKSMSSSALATSPEPTNCTTMNTVLITSVVTAIAPRRPRPSKRVATASASVKRPRFRSGSATSSTMSRNAVDSPMPSRKPVMPVSATAPVMPRNEAAEIWSPASARPFCQPDSRRPAT